jgi:DNA-binding beta-propeller fold protein YncE
MSRHRFNALGALLLIAPLAGCGGSRAVRMRDGSASRHGDPTPTATRSTPTTATTTSARASRAAPPQALVTDETQNRLVVVDLPSGRIARSLPLPPDPEDIATIGNGGVVIVVSSRAGKVTALSRNTLRPIKTFGGFEEPHIAAISPGGQYAYITDDARGTVTVIRLSDMKVTSTVTVGAGAHHLSFSPDQRRAWVGLGESATQISILDTTEIGHPKLIGRFDPGFAAHDVSFVPSGRAVLVSSSVGPDVTAFDPSSRRVLFRVPVGRPPQHIAFAGRYAYLTSGYGSSIERVDADTGRVIAKAQAPYGSFELAAADGFVTVASLLRGTLAIYTPALKRLRVAKVAPATREVAISRP